jgi:hypothetical protein
MPNKLTVVLVDDHTLARPFSRRTATPSWAKKKEPGLETRLFEEMGN